MLIRAAASDDLELITELRLRFVAEHRNMSPLDFTPEFRDQTRDFLDRHQRAATIRSWIAEAGGAEAGGVEAGDGRAEMRPGTAIGTVSMLLLDMAPLPEDLRSTDGYLINMYVEPAERGQGVGRALLDACRDDAQSVGVHRLLLFTTTAGRPLYEKAGFRADPDWLDIRLESA